jgi:MFS family permease
VSRTPLPNAYWRLWTAAAVSNLGDGVFVIALPLLAARITDDPVSVGLIAAFFTIPWLLFALPVGVLIDRSDRRRVLIIADLCRAALVGALTVAVALDEVQIWMLWILAFGLGLGEVFFDSGSQTILPAIVPDTQLERANGFFYATEVATNTFIGMPLGGALIAIAVWLPFGVDAASFVLAATLAATVRGSFRPTPAATHSAPSGLIADMRSGIRWLLDHALLRSLVIVVALMNLAFAATQATFVLFAKDELHISDRAFGPLLALVGLGALLAGLTGGRIIAAVGRRTAMVTAAVVPAATSALIGFFPSVWLTISLTTVQAFTTTIWSILAVSLRQQMVPTHLFGRVNSIYRWISTGAMPLGALFGGVLASAYGLRAPYFAAAGLLLLASIAIVVRMTDAALLSATPAPISPVDAPEPLGLLTDGSDDTPLALIRDPLDDLL